MKSAKEKLIALLNNKYVVPIKKLLMQGISPKSIALGIAGAAVIGVFPVLGSTTILCTAFALTFRLNLPLVQLINFTVYPLQLILLVPFMKLGEMFFHFERLRYGLDDIVKMISENTFNAIAVLWNVTLQAIGAWVIVGPVVALVIYFVLHYLLKRINYKLLGSIK